MNDNSQVGEASPRQLATDAAKAFHQVLAEMQGLLESRADRQSFQVLISRADRFADDLAAYGAARTLTPVVLAVLPVLCSVADRMRHATGPPLAVEVDVQRNCFECMADPAALEAALMQLAANASEAMPLGGRVLLRAHGDATSSTDPSVVIEMFDRGPGMSEAQAARAMTPFFTTKQSDHLSGMGLAAVSGFASQSGGELTLASRKGQGTTAMLRLPAGPPSQGAVAPSRPVLSSSDAPSTADAGQELLVREA